MLHALSIFLTLSDTGTPITSEGRGVNGNNSDNNLTHKHARTKGT